MVEKRVIDWEGIERDYRAGILSVREIATHFSVSHVAIAKRATRDGWERDLGAKIRAKADALVTKEAVTSLVTNETRLTEKAIVDANASLQANVRNSHRTDIQRAKRLTNRLLDVLEGLLGPKIEVERLREHIASLKQLTDTQRVVVAMEREAYGIAEFVEAPEEIQQRVQTDPMESARRVAFILSRAAALLPKENQGG